MRSPNCPRLSTKQDEGNKQIFIGLQVVDSDIIFEMCNKITTVLRASVILDIFCKIYASLVPLIDLKL